MESIRLLKVTAPICYFGDIGKTVAMDSSGMIGHKQPLAVTRHELLRAKSDYCEQGNL